MNKKNLTVICEETGVLGDRRFRAVIVLIGKETEKAIQVIDAATNKAEWIPKSQSRNRNGMLEIPQWLWDRKKLGWFCAPFSLSPDAVNAASN